LRSTTKKVFIYLCAAALFLALTLGSMGQNPFDLPPTLSDTNGIYQMPAGPSLHNITDAAQPYVPAPTVSSLPTIPGQTQPQQGVRPPTVPQNPGQTVPHTPTPTQPNFGTPVTPTAQPKPAATLPEAPNKSAAVALYVDAINRALSANAWNANRVETANMSVHTGQTVKAPFIGDVDIDNFFHKFIASPRTSTYKYVGGTWALSTHRNTEDLMSHKPATRYYTENGSPSSVKYTDDKYWNLSPKKSDGLSVSALDGKIRAGDIIKMSKTSTPENFLPKKTFTASDVSAYTYNKTASGATLVLHFPGASTGKAIALPNTAAMLAEPYIYDAAITKVTISFGALKLLYANPRVEVTFNADGSLATVVHSWSLGAGSNGKMSFTCPMIDNVENMQSTIDGTYSMKWTFSGWQF
jgi:hypothetical protein